MCSSLRPDASVPRTGFVPSISLIAILLLSLRASGLAPPGEAKHSLVQIALE